MLSSYTRLFRILFIIVFLKLLFLVALYVRTYDGLSRFSRFSTTYKVNIFDEILVDRRDQPTWEQRLQWIRAEMPSFPLQEMSEREKLSLKTPECGPIPDMMNIDFHNTYWQRAINGKLNYYVYGAYYDDRETVAEGPLVRLLTMVNQHDDKSFEYPEIFCQLWLKNRTKPVIVPVSEHRVMWPFGHAPRRYYPTFLSCPLPEGRFKWEIPEMVSLVGRKCDRARNLLRVVYEPREDETAKTASKDPRFMVCVKAMDFLYEDKSWRLIEWLELMRLLGASKVVLYDGQMHPNMTRVVKDYETNSPGFVELRPMSLGRGEPHAPPHFHHYAMASDGFNRILNEMIPYNDCFYRNMYKYDYVGVFDIDEVIMPLGNITKWSELVELSRTVPDDGNRIPEDCTEWVSFCFRNVYYPRYPERPKVYRNLSSSFYMLQHVERVQRHCGRGDATKCLHDTRYAVGLHNHFTFFHTEKEACPAKSIPIEYAQMQHYREPDTKALLIDPVVDASIWRFQPELQARVEERYQRLGFLPNEKQLADTLEKRRRNDERQLKEAVDVGSKKMV